MAQTFVPQALARMYQVAAGALPAMAVYLGGPTGADVPDRYAAVGYAGDDRAGVSGARVRNPHSEHWAEEFVVWCAVSTASGDQDPGVQLAQTESLYQTMVAALAADRTLGGLLLGGGYVEPGGYEWTVEGGGEVATVFFEMNVAVAFGM